jgi:TRAP-type C4-dicarboxylate transport system substrate-binding protein
MKSRKIALMTAAALSVAAATMFMSAANAQDMKLKFAIFGAPNNPINQCGPKSFMDALTKASNGKLTWETYYGASGFSTPNKLFEQTQRGITDVAWGLPDYTPGRFPVSELISLPFVVDDSVPAARAIMKLAPKYLAKEYSSVHLVSMTMVSPYQFHLRKAPNAPDDFAGLRLRAAGKSTKLALEKLGVAVAALPAPLTYENLQKGVIDGTLGTWVMLIAFKVAEVTSTHVVANFASLPLYLVMNKATYQKLSPEVRAAVDKFSTPEAAAEFARCFTRVDAKAIALAKSKGNTIVTLSPAQRAALRARVQPAIDESIKAAEAKGVPARAFVEEFSKAVAAEEAKK